MDKQTETPRGPMPLTRFKDIAIAAILTSLVLGIVYSNAWKIPFVMDDYHSILENVSIRSAGNIWRYFSDPQTFSIMPGRKMFRPLLLVSYLVNYKLFGFNVEYWRIFNLAFHYLSSLLVMGVVLTLTRRKGIALLIGLVFAVHPVNTEVVDYISSRSSSLAGMLFLTAMLFHFLWRRKPEIVAYRWASVIAFGISLLAKENVIVLPLLPWISDRMSLVGKKRSAREDMKDYAPHVVLIVAMFVARMFFLKLDTVAITDPVRSYGVHIFTQLSVIAYNIRTLLWPDNLNAFHTFPLFSSLAKSDAPFLEWPVVSIVLLVSAAFLIWKKGNRLVQFGGLWYVVALLPETFIPLNQVITERRLYLPMIGLLVMSAAGAVRLLESGDTKKRTVTISLAVLMIALFGAMSFARNGVWNDEERLWKDSIRKDPLNSHARSSLGLVYDLRGDTRRATTEWERAQRISPRDPNLLINLGVAYSRSGKLAEARELLLKAVERDPNNPQAYYNLAVVAANLGKRDEAMDAYRTAIRIAPTYTLPYNNLAALLVLGGQFQQARNLLEQSLKIDPGQTYVRNNLDLLIREHF